MRLVFGIGVFLFLCGVAAACVFWAGVDQAAGYAFGVGGVGIVLCVNVMVTQIEGWGVPNDHPRLFSRGH